MFRLGIVGHRYFRDKITSEFVAEQCLRILKQVLAEHPDLVAISAIAEGADTMFAEAALKLNLPVEIVRPFENYADDFKTTSAKRRYQKLWEAARKKSLLSFVQRSNDAYKAAMDWIIDESDVVVIVWDGHAAHGSGGTGDAVKKVISRNRPWFHVDVEKLLVDFHGVDSAGQ
jgi:hypothetical protein